MSERVDVDVADWVLSLEVGEHIPKAFEEALIDNLHRHNTEGIVLSWARVGQGGFGHVNERDQGYVVDRLVHLGYAIDEQLTESLRNAATLDWLRHNVLVFRKRCDGELNSTSDNGILRLAASH